MVLSPQGLTGRAIDAAVVSIRQQRVGKEFLSETSDYYLAGEHTFFGTDKERLENLSWLFHKKILLSIICGRGGYGASRLFPC